MVKLAIAAAGTGGHIFPGMAVAEVALASGHEVIWFGVRGGMEQALIEPMAVDMHVLQAIPVMGAGLARKVSGLSRALMSITHARRVLKRERVSVVLVMGGYVSFPVALAAKSLGIPFVIHEQNKVSGRANSVLARFATKLLTAFPDVFTGRASEVVGNPLRKSIQNMVNNGIQSSSQGPLNILVLGGSQGAAAVNQLMAHTWAMAHDSFTKVKWWHQCGRRHLDVMGQHHNDAVGIKISAFIDDMAKAYDWADVVIARAGAMTVSECLALGLPTLYIPLPNAVGNHQMFNAKFAVLQGAGWVWQQHEATPARLIAWLTDLAKQPVRKQPMQGYDAAVAIWQACLACLKL